jgi:hypothetical protein
MIYNDATICTLHSDIINEAFPLISLPHGKDLDSASLHEYMDELQVLVWLHCLRASLFFKHEAYANEAEYRFLQIHKGPPEAAPTVNHRMRPNELVRYREFDWRSIAPEALTKIVVGPAADKAKATLFANECLRTFNAGKPVEVVSSAIPYRSF